MARHCNCNKCSLGLPGGLTFLMPHILSYFPIAALLIVATYCTQHTNGS